MWQWIRHYLSAVVATVIDYGVMVALVEGAHVDPVPATALGAFAGAVSNFTLGRFFTYRATGGAMPGQMGRYLLVSAASLGWNTAGEYLFHRVLGIQYFVARAITSFVVSTAWNYPMQRYFVFTVRRPP